MEMENMMESKQNNLEQAEKIAQEIKNEFNDLATKAKDAIESNELLKNAIVQDGGLSMLLNEGFSFNVFKEGATNSRDRIMSYTDFPLEGYLRANEDRINISNLEQVLIGFKDRKAQVLEALSQPVTTEEEARALSRRIHKDLVLPVIGSEAVFN